MDDSNIVAWMDFISIQWLVFICFKLKSLTSRYRFRLLYWDLEPWHIHTHNTQVAPSLFILSENCAIAPSNSQWLIVLGHLETGAFLNILVGWILAPNFKFQTSKFFLFTSTSKDTRASLS